MMICDSFESPLYNLFETLLREHSGITAVAIPGSRWLVRTGCKLVNLNCKGRSKTKRKTCCLMLDNFFICNLGPWASCALPLRNLFDVWRILMKGAKFAALRCNLGAARL